MRRPGWRFWLWLAALLGLAATFLRPTWTLPQTTHRYLFVLDITQSMNARDYHLPGLPNERLGFAKAALEQALLELSCGSEVALAIFTHKNTHLLLAPLEVCRHAPALRDALRAIDWRNAWAADSYIAYGLFDALRTAKTLDSALVFFSDGQQLPATVKEPPFRGQPGKVKGWIVGVGGLTPVPIPRLDLAGRMNGYWQITDLPRSVHSPRLRSQAGPRQAGLLLSHLDEERLRRLATLTGLDYHHLTTPKDLADLLKQAYTGQTRPVQVDLRPWFGLAALGLALLALV